MVFVVCTRKGFDDLVEQFGAVPSPVWVGHGVLSDDELAQLRGSGMAVTNFTHPIAQGNLEQLFSAASTVREHHPHASMWIECAPDVSGTSE
ncbi:MAG: hypothetical protein EA401_09395 [Planctomycetota bacterium]|nr:MAG: hypothetical protein EA401_09395 [Planctomycetota bacterium]